MLDSRQTREKCRLLLGVAGVVAMCLPAAAQTRLGGGLATNDEYGIGVVHDGNMAVVGAYRYNVPGPGRVHVWERNSAVLPWAQIDSFQAPDAATSDRFGEHLAIRGEWFAVGAMEADLPGAANAGAVYLYRRNPSGVEFVQKLSAPTPEADARFGCALGMSDEFLLVGEYLSDLNGLNSGQAHIFRRSGTVWSHFATFTPTAPGVDDRFGWTVALEDGTAVVGAYVDDDPGVGADAGSATVWNWDGSSWNEGQKLQPTTPVAGETFGRNLALSGDRLIVSALGADAGGTDAGAAYILERSGGAWAQVAHLTSDTPASFGYFGWWVDIRNNRAVVAGVGDGAFGANSGTVHVFERDSAGTWAQSTRYNSPTAAGGDAFGVCVSLTDETLLVGCIGDNLVASNAGTVFAFDMPTSGPSLATGSWNLY